MKVERVSYDVITPSAARGIIEAIYWKPAILWKIDKIHVINPIKFDNIRRNERSGRISTDKIERAMRGAETALYQDKSEDAVQRASLVLRDVCYCIEAHFEMTNKKGDDDNEMKHYNVALRRMRKGQCFHQPYLGCREFPARFQLIEGGVPKSHYHGLVEGDKELGLMLWDIDRADGNKAIFYRARMNDGIIDVTECLDRGVFS